MFSNPSPVIYIEEEEEEQEEEEEEWFITQNIHIEIIYIRER